MIEAEINFKDKRRPEVLHGVITIKLLDGYVTWRYMGEKGPATFTLNVDVIDYIRLGNQ